MKYAFKDIFKVREWKYILPVNEINTEERYNTKEGKIRKPSEKEKY